jgi:hypothetical protein
MVMFAVFVEEANEPLRRELNASPDAPDDFVGGTLGLGMECRLELGVIGLELGAVLPAEESMENTSCCAFRGCKLVGAEPSFC